MNNLLLNSGGKLNEYSQKIRDIQKVRECEKINKNESTKTSLLTNLIIKPVSVSECERSFSNEEYERKKKEYEINREKYWLNRSNAPYKGITDATTNIKTESELVIHRVSNLDKLNVEERYDELKRGIEQHNNELKEKYAFSKEATNRKKFEYSHRYSDRKKYNPQQHKDLKESVVTSDMVDKEALVSQLVSNGIFSEDELKMFGLS